jgi:hypothetical protein
MHDPNGSNPLFASAGGQFASYPLRAIAPYKIAGNNQTFIRSVKPSKQPNPIPA